MVWDPRTGAECTVLLNWQLKPWTFVEITTNTHLKPSFFFLFILLNLSAVDRSQTAEKQ